MLQTDASGWTLMKPVVFGEIMDFFAEGKPVMLDEPVVTDTTILDDDDEVVAMIKELLQERVRLRYSHVLPRITCSDGKSVPRVCGVNTCAHGGAK